MTEAVDAFSDLLRKAEERERPISALLELTHHCNVDCEHCYLDLVPDKKIGALETEDWKRIIGELAEEGCFFLTLSGGEVLMRRDWFELAQHARSLGLAVRFYTNGTLITEQVADKIAAIKPLDVEISVLGSNAATHDAVARRAGAFDKTIAGAKRLRARGVSVMLKCVVMKRNVAEYAAIKALADDLGCEMMFDIEVTPKDNGSREPTELTAESADDVVHGMFASGAPDASDAARAARLASVPCAAGRRTCQIGPTGDVFACTSWTKPLGNLRSASFREVWRESPLFLAMRAKRIGSFPVCARCDLLAVCSPCMALSMLEQGNLDGPSPTRCRGAETKGRALGMPGEAGGFKERLFSRPDGRTPPDSSLVQLRRKSA